MDKIKSAFTFKNQANEDYHPLSEDASVRAPLNRSIYDTSMNDTTMNFLDNDFEQVVHSNREERKSEQESEADFKAKSYEFLKNLGDLFTEFADQKKDIVSFLKYCRYLDNVANNLCKNIQSATDHRLEITDEFYKEDNFISTLMSLGFEMDINSKGDLVLTMTTQPSKKLLIFVIDFLWREYLSKAAAVPELQEEKKKIERENNLQTVSEAAPQTDQARFLASKHEQRITQKYHPSSVNHNSKAVPMDGIKKKLPDNWSFQRNSISTDAASATFQNPQSVSYRNMSTQELRKDLNNQLSDYRERMRNRRPEDIPTYVPPEQDTTSSVFGSIKKHIKKAIGSENEQNGESKQKGGMMTGLEIEKKRIEEDKVAFGMKALELTNEFRARNNLRPLIWNQELCDIAMQHSKNMAQGIVPFSHEGFQDRCNQIRFLRWSACENVAYNSNCQSPPTAAVNGWIESPGHRKNMLSNSNACGIACYRSENGAWYFTQFIVLKDETFNFF